MILFDYILILSRLQKYLPYPKKQKPKIKMRDNTNIAGSNKIVGNNSLNSGSETDGAESPAIITILGKPIITLGGCSKLIHFIFGIVGIIFGANNLDNSCSKSHDLFHLAIWMITQGIIMLSMATPFVRLILGSDTYLEISSIYSLFQFIWTIIGTVILSRDSVKCDQLEDNSFYVTGEWLIAVSWLLIIFNGYRFYIKPQKNTIIIGNNSANVSNNV